MKGSISCIQRCLRAFEECAILAKRVHYLTTDCKREIGGCGQTACVEFELERDWIMSIGMELPRDLPGKCNCGLRCDLCDVDSTGIEHKTVDSVGEEAVSEFPSSPSNVSVFISHAGEQKDEVAYPLRDSLRWADFKSFLDAEDLRPSTDTVSEQLVAALQQCEVAVFVLSPDFVSKKWPMWELRQMLKRKREARKRGERGPGLFPLFYKLSVEECKDGQLCEKYHEAFEQHGLFEASGARSCSKEEMLGAVRELTSYSGEETRAQDTAAEYVGRVVAKLVGSFRSGKFN